MMLYDSFYSFSHTWYSMFFVFFLPFFLFSFHFYVVFSFFLGVFFHVFSCLCNSNHISPPFLSPLPPLPSGLLDSSEYTFHLLVM